MTKDTLFTKKAFVFDFDGTLVDSMRYWISDEVRACDGPEEWFAYMKTRYDSEIGFKADAGTFLNEVRRRGIRFCIASHTPLFCSSGCFTRLGVDRGCSFYISPEDVGSDKHDARFYLVCAERLGFSSDDCVVFEDHPFFAGVARRAGFSVVGIRESCYAANEDELKHNADVLITSYAELITANTANTLCDPERKNPS